MRYLDRLQPLALLVLRIVLGVIMIGHGYSKVFGGLSHHVQFVSSLGLPGWLAYVSAVTEFFGGILVIAGLLTQVCFDRHPDRLGSRHREGALEEWTAGQWRLSVSSSFGCDRIRAGIFRGWPYGN